MAKSYGEDLRSRVIAAVDGGMSRSAAAARFEVGKATAIAWLRAWRDEGRSSAKPKGGDTRSHRIEAFAPVILAAVEARRDVTLDELVAMLDRDHGKRFARSAVHRFFARRGITFKKRRSRQRAGPPGRGAPPAGLVRRPARPRSRAADLHRRERGQAPRWPGCADARARRALPSLPCRTATGRLRPSSARCGCAA